jgi:hypothetical protein
MIMSACKDLRAFGAAIAVGSALLLPGVAAAQDAHYWTNQYGTRAELLGGLVVGSVVDHARGLQRCVLHADHAHLVAGRRGR